MAGERAAIRYAKAVLSLATDNNTADAVNVDMELIKDTVANSKDLKEMLYEQDRFSQGLANQQRGGRAVAGPAPRSARCSGRAATSGKS